MADRRRPRARPAENESGLDVWLPALVAIVAAIFMLMSAHAAESGDPAPVAAPRAIFDVSRFDIGAIDREATAAAIARGDYAAEPVQPMPRHLMAGHVVVAVLPEVAPLADPVPAVPALPAIIAWTAPAPAEPGHAVIERLLALAAIGGLLIATLLVLARVWRRTEQPTAV